MSKVKTIEEEVFQPKVKRSLTLPLLKPQLEKPFYVKFEAPIFKGKKITSGAQKDMEAATLANCTNVETGELVQIIVPAVLEAILEEEYDDDGYVGRAFKIVKHAKQSGKRYHTFSVAEIEI